MRPLSPSERRMEGAHTLPKVTLIIARRGRRSIFKAALMMTCFRSAGLFSLIFALGLCRNAMADTSTAAIETAPRDSAPTDDASMAEDIVVTAGRYGEARVKAESEFSEDEISTFGADDIQDLLGRMGPLIDPTEEEPVILINGQPAGFDTSVLSYPAEALDRVAVLAPEAAAEYGQPAGKRVINLVLKKNFSSLHADAGLSWATEGGQHGGKFSAGRVSISGPTRWNVQTRISTDSALRKSDRNIPQIGGPVDAVGYISSTDGGEIDPALSHAAGTNVTHAAIPPGALTGRPTLEDFAATANRQHPVNPSAYETLQPSRRSMSFNAGVTRPLGEFSASLSINATDSKSRGQRGLPMASLLLPADDLWSPFAQDVVLTRPFAGERALRNNTNSKSLGVSLTLSGRVAGWQTNFSARYGRNWSNSLLERGVDSGRIQDLINAADPEFNPYGRWDDRYLLSSRNRSRGENISTRLNVSGKVIDLPAGPITTNISLNASRNRAENRQSDSLHGSMPLRTTTRERADGQVTLSLPLSRRAKGEFRPLGDLTLEVSMSGETESNGPFQKRYGSGVTWSPVAILQLRGAFEHMELAPSFEQLDDPVITTIGRIYDYTRQEMAEPVWITGGNPNLQRGSSQSLAVSATVRPFNNQDLALNVGYRQRVAKGGVAAFPELTPAIEAAFPERVTRDAQGRLIAVDARAINIAHETSAELTSGITVRWQEGAGAEKAEGQAKPAAPLMVTASLNHHWRLKSELLTRPGIPPIDQLGRDGGQSRHKVSFQITAGKRGLGASLNANWTGAAHLRSATSAQDFHLKSSILYNYSMHIEPYRVLESLADKGWAKHLRISLEVQNLFNGYRRVTFSDGSIPPGYSRDEIDPLGRTVRLSVRKRF